MLRRSMIAALFLCLATTAARAGGLAPAAAEMYSQATFRDWFELLALPNDAIVPADVQKNADWLEVAFRKRGWSTFSSQDRCVTNQTVDGGDRHGLVRGVDADRCSTLGDHYSGFLWVG